MSTPWYRRLSEGLSRSREKLGGELNVLLRRGPNLDEEFWSELEDTLIVSDMGFVATTEIVARLRRLAAERALPDAPAVVDALAEQIAAEFPEDPEDLLLHQAGHRPGGRRQRGRQDHDRRQAGQAGQGAGPQRGARLGRHLPSGCGRAARRVGGARRRAGHRAATGEPIRPRWHSTPWSPLRRWART